MNHVAHQIDQALREIVLCSENQLEILVGHCQSDVTLTNTQEHILMLIEDSSFTNSEIAKQLNVSQAAITKAIKSLMAQGMLLAVRDEKDARVIHYQLTDLAKPIAEEHSHHHHHTIESYNELLTAYSDSEQEIISRFLNDLIGKIRK